MMGELETVFLNDNNVEDFLREVYACNRVAMDTEFSTTRSYRGILSLVQLYMGGTSVYVFDAQDTNISKNGLIKVLEDKTVVKVIHACRQDGEAIYFSLKTKIENVFDTQIGAKFLNLGKQISYGNIVKEMFGDTLDKAHQFCNWLRRPLDDARIKYAALDVKYLLRIYDYILENLTNEETLQVIQGSKELIDAALGERNVMRLWGKFKHAYDKFIPEDDLHGAAKRLFMFRDHVAQKRNILPRYVISDRMIVELVLTKPKTIKELREVTKLPHFLRADMVLNVMLGNHKD